MLSFEHVSSASGMNEKGVVVSQNQSSISVYQGHPPRSASGESADRVGSGGESEHEYRLREASLPLACDIESSPPYCIGAYAECCGPGVHADLNLRVICLTCQGFALPLNGKSADSQTSRKVTSTDRAHLGFAWSLLYQQARSMQLSPPDLIPPPFGFPKGGPASGIGRIQFIST